MTRAAAYNASSIAVLSGLEAVRKNPGMYVGSTGAEGLHQLAYEVLYNSIDEFLAGHSSNITLTLEKDGSCVVEDDGRGIPVETHPAAKRPASEVVFTTLHSGGKFAPGSYRRSAGIHGVGLACVNALSKWVEMEVWRGGKHYRQRFVNGKPSKLEALGSAKKTGTRVSFLPDPAIFKETKTFSYDTLRDRLEEMAFLHKGISIRFEDKRSKKLESSRSESFHFDGGISGYVSKLARSRTPIHENPISIERREKKIEFELALQWTGDYQENILSYVNSVHTVYGGTHVTGLKSALMQSVNAYAQEMKLLKINESEKIAAFDVLEGLTCVLSVRMDEPIFEGQTKKRLMNPEAQGFVEKAVLAELKQIFKRDSKLASRIVHRALDATRARLAARRASEEAHFQDGGALKISEEVYKKQFGARSRNWHESAAWITDQELLSGHVEHLKLGKDARMLDVCCGSGVVGASFKGKVGRIDGLDLTPEMIALAKTRLDEVHQGTIYNLPFKDGSYDAVVTREVLHLLPSPEKPVSEIFRVLRPGGQFIVGHILPFGAEDAAWMYRIFKKKQPLTFTMFQEEDFRKLLLEAGFVDIKMTERHRWESIDVWIDSYETTSLHRHEIRELFYNAPQEAKAVHPFEILPSGEIRDLWRWCIFSARKPGR